MAVTEATARIARFEAAISAQLPHWRVYPLVLALQALRGFREIQAATIATEIAGIERFSRARALMGYLGLVPSEYSSADSRNQGRITKTSLDRRERLRARRDREETPRLGRLAL